MRVILLTGKGGVGKTSHAVATALGAARCGHRVFLLSTDSAHSLGDSLGCRIGPRPVPVADQVVAQEVGVLDELAYSWSEIQEWLRELLREETDELVAEELLVFPGLEELIALRAIRQVEAMREFDVCVVDCAPTGSTLRMLRFPDVLRIFMENFFDFERRGARLLRPLLERIHAKNLIPREQFFDAFERLYREIEEVRRILLDRTRTSARLVVNPTRVVVEETRRSFAYLCLYGVNTDGVIVNRELPAQAAEGYFSRWREKERSEIAAIEASFPVPIFHAPLYPHELIGKAMLATLSNAVYGDRDPAEFFLTHSPLRLFKRGAHTVLELDAPNIARDDVSVAQNGDVLVVHLRDAHRLIALPDSVLGKSVEEVSLRDGVLAVLFEA